MWCLTWIYVIPVNSFLYNCQVLKISFCNIQIIGLDYIGAIIYRYNKIILLIQYSTEWSYDFSQFYVSVMYLYFYIFSCIVHNLWILPDGSMGSRETSKLQKGIQGLPSFPKEHRSIPSLIDKQWTKRLLCSILMPPQLRLCMQSWWFVCLPYSFQARNFILSVISGIRCFYEGGGVWKW